MVGTLKDKPDFDECFSNMVQTCEESRNASFRDSCKVFQLVDGQRGLHYRFIPNGLKEKLPYPEIVHVSSVTRETFEAMDGTVLTMVDVQKEVEALEECATAVLGACDENNCTYSQGYVKRQAVYACLTCTPGNRLPGGVCLACSYHCHDGHNLLELYTKRAFRCDCGNSKYSGSGCNLEPYKDRENKLNKYNQNFRGLYCVCKRPYPDPDMDVDDKMLQCIICEDWYHEGHLGKPLPLDDDYEVICEECMKKVKYLIHYANDSNSSEETGGCSLSGKENPVDVQTTFFPAGWRERLCPCTSCREQYKSHGVGFLLDSEDTLEVYEEYGRAKLETQEEKEIRALSVLNRFQQVECIRGYNDMKQELKEYLKKFVENGKIVREEDIKEFFAGMEARKKQRMNVQIPYHCH